MKEIYDILGIDKKVTTIVKVDKSPFTELDSDHLNIWYMKDGTIKEDKYPFKRYSTYLTNFNIAAEQFGYKLLTFKESYIEGYWLFNNTNTDYPWITIQPGYIHDQFNFKIHIEFDDRVDLKTYQDCFNVLYKSLKFKFEREIKIYPDSKSLKREYRNLKLIKLFNSDIIN